MSDFIKHECGIATHPIAASRWNTIYEKYGTALYGIHQLQLLMEKQRNRGQDGAGLSHSVKLDRRPRPQNHRPETEQGPGTAKPSKIFSPPYTAILTALKKSQTEADVEWLKANVPFYMGELLLGHLRYGTHGEKQCERTATLLSEKATGLTGPWSWPVILT